MLRLQHRATAASKSSDILLSVTACIKKWVRAMNRGEGHAQAAEKANYFKRGLEAYPNLAFEILDVMWGL